MEPYIFTMNQTAKNIIHDGLQLYRFANHKKNADQVIIETLIKMFDTKSNVIQVVSARLIK